MGLILILAFILNLDRKGPNEGIVHELFVAGGHMELAIVAK